jgi:hypothetical protein
LAACNACQARFYVAAKSEFVRLDIAGNGESRTAATGTLIAWKVNGRWWPGTRVAIVLAFGTARFCIINREAQ